MRPKLTLAGRAFLVAFIPICVTLILCFSTIRSTVREQVKQGLREVMLRTESTLNKENADVNRRNMQLLAMLGEGAGFKTGIGLLDQVIGAGSFG